MLDLSIVVPVYKEEKNIPLFMDRLEEALSRTSISYEVIFALDPSPDQTEMAIRHEIEKNSRVKLLVFSRRFGQPAATMAGISYAIGDAVAIIDVDLQDPPELIPNLYTKYKEGFDVVYAKRKSRKGEMFLKRVISYVGYFIINKLSEVEIPRNVGDFRVMSRRVVDSLKELNETHGFLRGLVAYVGYSQSYVEYDRDERLMGQGHYNRITGSLKIGMNGLINFGSRPLQFMSIAGLFFATISFMVGLWFLIMKLSGHGYPTGFPTILVVVTFFFGTQLLALGLMGEYIGRIYDEVKRRPAFILDKKINFEE